VNSEPGVQLTDVIVTPLELGKVQRELFALNEFLSANNHGTSSGKSMPYTSPLLSNMVKASGLNMIKKEDRTMFNNQLQFVRRTAPVVRVSFAAEPSKQALRVLVRWFRENGHPNTLLDPSVQPGIGGGCIINTSTKTFDFSIKNLFVDSLPELAKKIV
jgi:F0F1-type ATP synthase delta subunit